MPSPSSIEVRRCRPLLGTFVEIAVYGPAEPALHDAVDAAFAVVEGIQRRMGVHDPVSELARVNREAASRPVSVSPDTFEVLRRAVMLSEASDGAFDIALAPALARWGLLPSSLKRRHSGTWRDLLLLPDGAVAYRRPLAVDLGGIAKGFAVDAAMETLARSGVTEALINAGGDLRAAGPRAFPVHIRHPAHPGAPAGGVQLRQAALATSSPCFTQRTWRGRRVSHLAAPGGRRAATGAVSVTVRAPECWLADALTKVVLFAPDNADRILRQFGAEAIVLTE